MPTEDTSVTRYSPNYAHIAAVPDMAYALSMFVRRTTAISGAVLTEAVNQITTAVSRFIPAEVDA